MRDRVNQVVKKREGFRPFAPMVTYDDQSSYFDYTEDVPYMNQVVQVNEKYQKSLPSITHIDGSARIQTVRENNKRIYKLLKQFKKDSGFPILLNTSFNLKGQTMVNDPKTAIETFLKCDMDYLVLGNYLVRKI
jgi:carbamoyltransferase